jgi:hypothetical protein
MAKAITTAICAASIAAVTSSPHNKVPQNCHTRGERWGAISGALTADRSGTIESIQDFQ